MFKNIFNKSTKKAEQGQSESIAMEKLYPYLMSGNNPLLEEVLRRTIIGTVENPALVLTFGIKDGTDFTLLRPKQLIGSNLEDFNRAYMVNMESTEYEIEVSQWEHGRIVSNTRNSLASEFILSEKIMNEFHEKLGFNEMWVSIPTRGVILATDKNSSNSHMRNFLNSHKRLYLESPNNLMRDLLVFQNGVLVGSQNMKKLFEE